MRLPIPKNKLVAVTLAGALLTAVIAGALAFPVPGVTVSGDTGDGSGEPSSGVPQADADVPTPNQEFTPAVRTQPGYEDEEHDEYEEDDDHDDEYEEDDDHDDEYEEDDERGAVHEDEREDEEDEE